jgi:hypothetical protein
MPDASFPAKVERFTEGPFKGEPKTFVCDECGMTRTVGRGGLRGYGVKGDGSHKVCYDCAARAVRREVGQMRKEEKVPA